MNRLLTLILCVAFFSGYSQRKPPSPQVQKLRQQLAIMDRQLDSLRAMTDAASVAYSRYDSILADGSVVSKPAPSDNPDSLRIWQTRKVTAEHRFDELLVRLDRLLGARNELVKKIAL